MFTPEQGTMDRSPLLLSFLLDRGCKLQPDNLIVERTPSGYNSITYAHHEKEVCTYVYKMCIIYVCVCMYVHMCTCTLPHSSCIL